MIQRGRVENFKIFIEILRDDEFESPLPVRPVRQVAGYATPCASVTGRNWKILLYSAEYKNVNSPRPGMKRFIIYFYRRECCAY